MSSEAPSDRRRTTRLSLSHSVVGPLAQEVMRRATQAANKIAQGKPPARLAVRLGKKGFALTWGIVLFFHLFNAIYTLGLAYIYVYLRKPEMEYYIGLIKMMPQSTYVTISVLYAIISALNFQQAFSMILFSIAYKRLAFYRRRKPRTTTKVAADVGVLVKQTSRRFAICLPLRVTKFLAQLQRATSIQGHLFDTKLLLREVVEVASQTYQAHSSSLLISKVWINQLFGLLVCLNCVANTAVHIFKEEEAGMRRFLCTLIDLGLDFAWGFIFPGNIIFYYLPLFINNMYGLPAEFYQSDTYLIKAMLDCRQFFMVSWADVFTTLLPYMNIFSGLMNVKILLEIEDTEQQSPLVGQRGDQKQATATVTPLAAPVPVPAASEGPNGNAIPAPTQPQTKPLLRRLGFMIIIPIFGIAVLATSLAASGMFGADTCGAGCKLRMKPWFGTHCACSVLEINCDQRGIKGSATEMREIFLSLDERVLNSLIITHCPKLAMPAEFQLFPNLLGLEFYNVSFEHWSREAALSQTHFPMISYVYIARSQLGPLPEGLTYNTPHSLVDIEISACEMDELPEDLDEMWPNVIMLYVEFCGLQKFPVATTRMALTDFSLVGNNISVIPEDLPEFTNWMYVYLDRNPLQKLPGRFGGMPNIQYLTVQVNNISYFPPWFYELHDINPYLIVSANRTPICEALQLEPEERPEVKFIRCPNPNTYVWNGVFPLFDKDDKRRISPEAPLPSTPEQLLP